MNPKVILISTCLLDIPCQYDGKLANHRLSKEELDQIGAVIVPVCPEQLSGLSTPRKPMEISGGDGFDVLDGTARVMSKDGEDFTQQFISAAEMVLEICRVTGAKKMICQRRSPSCAATQVYDGHFCHQLRPGPGVTAALLARNGIKLLDVEQIKGEILPDLSSQQNKKNETT